MTSAIINRIGRKVQMAVAGAVIASSLAVAIPMTASAQTATCADFNGDGRVNIADAVYVVNHYRQPKPGSSDIFTIADMLAIGRQMQAHTQC
jgi:hypothetical protein